MQRSSYKLSRIYHVQTLLCGVSLGMVFTHPKAARNAFCFEFKRLDPAIILDKAITEAQIWSELQAPPRSEIAYAPYLTVEVLGLLVTRMVKLSSIVKASFSNVSNPLEADLCSLLWSIEAMRSLRMNKVVFESSSVSLRDAFLYPSYDFPTWPLVLNIRHAFDGFGEWRVEHVIPVSNKVASMIALSVTTDLHYQSYVASGGPSWLRNLLEQEAANPHSYTIVFTLYLES
ncbi:hypothetical protein IGI04_036782 [Brassica rapa subsp. trilocularis]|uniref:RNase H type-1 domain-containing protein n=1 Tax=Brassica rapa subsp. trilocularis TaxID=1813537 RepID=A0ABQ7LFH8_BRACM|nr:hypothetical protein IGI04_036782 [Brassica rapa subsp. trilocularis]